MRRLLSLAVMAGLAAPTGALADTAPRSTTATTATTPSSAPTTRDPQVPSFIRELLVKAGVVKPEPPVHPWFAWWLQTFGVDPHKAAAATSTAKSDTKATTSDKATASR